MFEKQSPTFDVTFVFMLFRIIYTGRAALTLGNNKTSRQYWLEIYKEIAVLSFQNFIFNEKLRMTLICKSNFNMEKSIFSINT